MKKIFTTAILFVGLILLSKPVCSQKYIADYSVAKEEILRSIPVEYINSARTNLVIAYQHTSHGTHVFRGVSGLQDYKEGDDVLFSVSETSEDGKLEFRDYALQDYAPDSIVATDLSKDETAFIQTTRNYLDAPENASVNVVMWSWCNIMEKDIRGNYLPGMDSLMSEYGPGGTKIGTGEGQRAIPVKFIFMTGHAVKNANERELWPKNQGDIVIDHCNTNGYLCLDYYSIDTYDMDDNYWADTGDNGDSDSYGGNFYEDWQNSHTLGVDYFENKLKPGGGVVFGSHNTQHITANRKAYAFWWILARMAGWDGEIASNRDYSEKVRATVYPNPGHGQFFVNNTDLKFDEIQIFNIHGAKVYEAPVSIYHPTIMIDLSDHPPGAYSIRLLDFDLSEVSQALTLKH